MGGGYNFHEIDHEEFKNLASTVLSKIYDVPFLTFRVGKDGGRDAVARGVDIHLGGGRNLKKQNVVVQVKHTKNGEPKLDKSARKNVFDKEKVKVEKMVKRNELDVYIIVTNYFMTSLNEEKLTELYKAAGAKDVVIVGYETLTRWLDETPKLKKDVLRLYHVGDKTDLLNHRSYEQGLEVLKHYKDKLSSTTKLKAFEKAKELLEEKGLIFVTGPPGSAKTTVASYVAVQLSDDYEFHCISQPSKFEELWNPNQKQLFFVDGLCQIDQWCDLVLFGRAKAKGSKFVFTGRLEVYAEVRQKSEQALHQNGFCSLLNDATLDLSDHQLELSKGEKREMLKTHIEKGDNDCTTKEALLKEDMLSYASQIISCSCYPVAASWLGSRSKLDQFKTGTTMVYDKTFLDQFFQNVVSTGNKQDNLTDQYSRKRRKESSEVGPMEKKPKNVEKPRLPDMPPHFTGRQREVDDVMAQVSSLSTRLLTIWGSGGFGKTALAVALCHRLHQQGTTAWFVSLREVDTIEGMIVAILGVVDPNCLSEKGDSNFLGSLCALFRSVTSTSALILDNVDDLLAVGGDTKKKLLMILENLLQQNTNLNIVCTSRESMNYAKLTVKSNDLRIKKLQTSESTKLLQNLVPDQDLVNAEKECAKLSNVCDNAPLGLKLMGAIMCDDKVTPQDLLSELEKSNILKVIDSEDYPDDQRVHKVFEVSFKRLTKEFQKMFVFLSVFPSSFEADAAAAVLSAESPLDVKKRLSLLERKSLLDYDANSKRYSMHALLRAFAQLISQKESEMCPYRTESRVRFQRYFLNLLKNLNNKFLTGESLNAVQCFHREKENLIFFLQDATTCDTFLANITDELTNMDIFLDTIFWNDATPLDKVYDQFLSKYKDKTTSHAVCYANILLSKTFSVLHHDHPDELLLEADDVIKDLPYVPPDVQGKLFCFWAFQKLISNQVDEGIILFEKGILLLSSQLSSVVIKVLALRVLADCYAFKKNTDKASATIKEALRLIQKHQQLKPIIIIQQTKKHEVDYANQPFFGAIGYFLSHFSRITESTNYVKDFLIKTTEQLRESKGDSLEIAQQHDMQATSLMSVGCNEEATKHRRHALDIRLKLLGEDNEDTAGSYYNLGMTHYKLGDYSSALDAVQHSLDIRLKLLGEDNENTARSRNRVRFLKSKLAQFEAVEAAESN